MQNTFNITVDQFDEWVHEQYTKKQLHLKVCALLQDKEKKKGTILTELKSVHLWTLASDFYEYYYHLMIIGQIIELTIHNDNQIFVLRVEF